MKICSIITLSLFILLFSSTVSAQIQQVKPKTQHEIGVSFSNFDNFSFIYKRGLSENKFLRISATSFGISTSNDFEAFRFRFGSNIGIENRKKHNDRLSWYHGPEFGLFTNVNIAPNQQAVTIVPNFGYILGAQYSISDRFYISTEIKPRITGSFSYNQASIPNNNFGIDLTFGSGATFGIVHRI